MNWAAKMAVGLETGVPWIMCKDDNAPDPIVRIVMHISTKIVQNCKKIGMIEQCNR